jgi:hypothetical protein
MRRFTRWPTSDGHIMLVPLALLAATVLVSAPARANQLTITPPNVLVLDGQNITTGRFELEALTGLEPGDSLLFGNAAQPCPFQNLTTGVPGGLCGGTQFIPPDPGGQPVVVIDPAVIGSGMPHVLFDYPGAAPTATIMEFRFIANATGVITQSMTTISAIPDFDISLPLSTGLGDFFEVIDFAGNVSFWQVGDVTTDPSLFLGVPQIAVIDLFGDQSWFFLGLDPNQTGGFDPSDFQLHGRIRSGPPVPEPATGVLVAAALLGLAGRRAVLRLLRFRS